MISYLEGRIVSVTGTSCVLVTSGGTGYTVALPAQTLKALPKPGGQISLHTSLVVREDALELYGFSSLEERQTFELLVTISKVGARTALSVLSVFRPQDLYRIVLDDDPARLTEVPGIGKKSAQHIFLELKDKLKILDGTIPQDSSPAAGTVRASVVDGLLSLGYSESEAFPVVQRLLEENPELDVPETLRAALKALARSS